MALKIVTGAKEDKTTVHGAKIYALSANDNKSVEVTDEEIKKATIEIDGEKFIFVNKTTQSDSRIVNALKNNGFNEEHIVYSKEDAKGKAMTADDTLEFVNKVNKIGLEEEVAEQGITAKTDIIFRRKH